MNEENIPQTPIVMTSLRRSPTFWLFLVGWQLLAATAVYLRHSHPGGGIAHPHSFAWLGTTREPTDDGESGDHAHYIFLGMEFFFPGEGDPHRAAPEGGGIARGLIDDSQLLDGATDSVVVAMIPTFEPILSFAVDLSPRSDDPFRPVPLCARADRARSGVLRS